MAENKKPLNSKPLILSSTHFKYDVYSIVIIGHLRGPGSLLNAKNGTVSYSSNVAAVLGVVVLAKNFRPHAMVGVVPQLTQLISDLFLGHRFVFLLDRVNYALSGLLIVAFSNIFIRVVSVISVDVSAKLFLLE